MGRRLGPGGGDVQRGVASRSQGSRGAWSTTSAAEQGSPRGPRVRLLLVALLVVLVAGLALGLWAGTRPRSPEQRLEAAGALVAGVHVSAAVDASSLVATHAIADFGIDEGIRRVRVRIVSELRLSVRLEADRDVALAVPARLCVVGPYSAPDDAGLSSPCWGSPELGEILAAQLGSDAAGHPILLANRPIILAASLVRGNERCDYPPGEWHVEVVLNPLVDGSPAGDAYLPYAAFDVPLEEPGAPPLVEVRQTRYCGLASAVYREQGEPPVASP